MSVFSSLYEYFIEGGDSNSDEEASSSSSPSSTMSKSSTMPHSATALHLSDAQPNDLVTRLHSNSASDLNMSNPVHLETFEDYEDNYEHGRAALPAVMLQRDQISVWSILKHSIGKELSKITMPVVFNEPLSFVQRMTEHMEYVDLIQKASESSDPVKRLEYITAFSISALAANRERVAKPFNPLLGETYELDCTDELGFRIVVEQVSHHPPVSAYAAEGPVFRYEGSCYPKLRFYGRSIDVKPTGSNRLTLTSHDETYTWTNPSCSIHNLVMGKMYIEHHGVMEVTNHKIGLTAVLTLKSGAGWFGRDASHMEGFIVDKHKTKIRCLYGEWSDFLASCSVECFEQNFASWGKEHKEHKDKLRNQGESKQRSPPPQRRFSTTGIVDDDSTEPVSLLQHSKSTKLKKGASTKNCTNMAHLTVLPVLTGSDVLWRAKPRPPQSEQFYNFTAFAMMLNEFDPDCDKHSNLPPTDSRRRPDMRYMEDGNIDMASSEKHRLEEKQRTSRNDRKKSKSEWSPLWFREEKHPILKDSVWTFNDEYWRRDWNKCEQIF